MTEEAKKITAEKLNKRFEIEQKDELGELASVFNDLFSRIENSFDSLRRFTSDASHELRTPLTAIKSTCQVAIQSNKSDQDHRRTLEGVLEEIQRITDLVDSLLMLTRGDAGAIQPNKENLKLVEVANDVAHLLSVLAENKNQILEVKGSDVDVPADPVLIRQAIMGLLHNAIKYSPENTSIELEVSQSNQVACISISDEGPGISKEHQKRVFDRFYRIDPSRTRVDDGGAGLGLSIVKWIGKIHGGDVLVSEKPTGGSRFQLRIPQGDIIS